MVRFGVAGYPINFTKNRSNNNKYKIFKWLRNYNLDSFEMQMTYGPRTSKEKCKRYKELSQKYGIEITVHAAYYIVLTSKEKEKVRQSIDTLKKTYELMDILDSKKVVLHPGPLYNDHSNKPLNRFIENIKKFFVEIGDTEIELYAETAGKLGQLGSIDDIIDITKYTKCNPCIDFGHVHARTLGGLKTDEDIDNLFKKLYSNELLSNKLHFHYSPIKFGERGEITHKSLDDKKPIPNQLSIGFADSLDKNSDRKYYPRFERIIDNIVQYNINASIISETYNSQEIGASRMKNYYQNNLNRGIND